LSRHTNTHWTTKVVSKHTAPEIFKCFIAELARPAANPVKYENGIEMLYVYAFSA